MKRVLLYITGLSAGLMAFASCSEKMPEYSDGYKEPHDEIATCAPVNVMLQQATLKGISYKADEDIIERGFYFASSPIDVAAAASDESVIKYRVGYLKDGVFTYDVDNLELGTLYFVVAFAKRASGVIVTGEQKSFYPDYLELGEADVPSAIARSDSYKSATVLVSVAGFGTSALVGTDVTLLKPYELGFYIYKKGESKDNARIVMLETEAEANAVAANSTVSFSIGQLKGGTEYKVVPFVTIGLYRDYDEQGVCVLGTKEGDEVSFSTLPTPPPAVSVAPVENITTFSAILNATVVSNSDDMDAEVGFYLGTSEEGLIDDANKTRVTIDLSETSDFSNYYSSLTSFTDYYAKAYIKANGQTAYSDLVSFKTLFLSNPAIQVMDMNYEYRLQHVTSASAEIMLKLTEGMDPSFSGYGIKWGLAENALTNTVDGAGMDELTGEFTIVLEGLTPGTPYFFAPFATNGAGGITDPEVVSFTTAATAREYLYDASVSTKKQMYERMSRNLPDCKELSYFELDPIEGTSATYYLLDRNLGSHAPYLSSDAGKRISNLEADENQRKRVGAYYQWGRDIPSVTWQMPAGANLNKNDLNYSWIEPTAVKGSSWEVNPCPDGYEIPTIAQWNEILAAAKGEEALATIQSIYGTLLVGPTAFINPTNGGRNTGKPYDCFLWTKDVTTTTDPVEVFTVQPSASATQDGIVTVQRNACAPVRCVRVVTK